MDCSPPGSSVHGIFQVWRLEWVAISFSRRSSWPRDWTWVSWIVDRCFTIWATREVTSLAIRHRLSFASFVSGSYFFFFSPSLLSYKFKNCNWCQSQQILIKFWENRRSETFFWIRFHLSTQLSWLALNRDNDNFFLKREKRGHALLKIHIRKKKSLIFLINLIIHANNANS